MDIDTLLPDQFTEFLDAFYQEAIIEHPSGAVGWLTDNGPDPLYWHEVCLNWNHDFGLDVIRWIIGQDECSATTASGLLLSYSSECINFTRRDQFPTMYADDYNLIADVAERLRSEKYTAGLIKSDARLIPLAKRHIEACCEITDSSLWELPAHLLPPLNGEFEFTQRTFIKPRSGGGVWFDQGRMMMGMQEWFGSNPGRFSWN